MHKVRLVPDFFMVFGKALYQVKASGLQYMSIVLDLAYNESKLYKTLDYRSRDILNFYFLEKRLEIIFPPHFVYDFSTKMFFILYSNNCPNFIV